MIRFILLYLFVIGRFLPIWGQLSPSASSTPAQWFVPDSLDSWEIQFLVQRPFLTGEVRPGVEWGGGLRVARSLGHTFGLRLGWDFGQLSGLDWQAGVKAGKNESGLIYRNYRTSFQRAAIEGVFRINNLHFRHAQPRWTYYASLGLGAMRYQTLWDQQDANDAPYDYSVIKPAGVYEERKDKIAALQNLQDGTYETAPGPDPLRPVWRNQNLAPSFSAGLGIRRRLGPTASLALEYRVAWQNQDDLDGYRLSRTGEPTSRMDLVHSPSLSLNILLGKQREGYPWHNPLAGIPSHFQALDSQLDSLQAQVSQLEVALQRKPDTVLVLRDTQTETSNLAMAQLLTRVDSLLAQREEGFEAYLFFAYDKARLEEKDYHRLFRVVQYLREHPQSRMAIIGHADGKGSEAYNQELSLLRAQHVARSLTDLFGIEADRLVVQAKGEGDPLVLPGLKVDETDWRMVQALNRRVVIRSVLP